MLIASVHGHSHLANLKKCNKFCLCGFQNRQFSHSVPKKVEKNSTTKKNAGLSFCNYYPNSIKKDKDEIILICQKIGVVLNRQLFQ